MEVQFPIEFTVAGTPVSLQAARPASRAAWMQRVRAASFAALPEGHFWTEEPVSATLLYFPPTSMQGDLDNIIKPILDAARAHLQG